MDRNLIFYILKFKTFRKFIYFPFFLSLFSYKEICILTTAIFIILAILFIVYVILLEINSYQLKSLTKLLIYNHCLSRES